MALFLYPDMRVFMNDNMARKTDLWKVLVQTLFKEKAPFFLPLQNLHKKMYTTAEGLAKSGDPDQPAPDPTRAAYPVV